LGIPYIYNIQKIIIENEVIEFIIMIIFIHYT
jgi:hypothetical protein